MIKLNGMTHIKSNKVLKLKLNDTYKMEFQFQE
jgi:hypothetical protein